MITAERWADVPAGCVCRWTARQAGGWVRAQAHPGCPEHRGEDELAMDEPRVTAYWYASQRGLPCDLEYLKALGAAAARHARWQGIPVLRVPEGPYLVHAWPEAVWDEACRTAVTSRDPDCSRCNYDTHRCPGCGEPLPHGTEVCAGCGNDEAIPPRLPRDGQALRAIGY